MTRLLRHEPKEVERFDMLDPFGRMFDDWMTGFPFRRLAFPGWDFATDEVIRVDAFRENGTLVVRADLPGIDPDKDVELTVSDGMLTITAERHAEEKKDEKGYLRRELRYGSFTRTLQLPEGVSEADIKATYTDGILEIRVPVPEPTPTPTTKVPITKS